MTRSTSSPSTGPLPVAPGELDLHLLLEGSHRDPHGVLGPHRRPDSPGTVVVRTLQPGADEVDVVIEAGPTAGRYPLAPVGTAGMFAGTVPGPLPHYRLAVRSTDESGGDTHGDRVETIVDDPYRFSPVLGPVDLHLIGEGRHERLWDALGAHFRRWPTPSGPVEGTSFTVWAPNARGVRVVGDWAPERGSWDGVATPMRALGSGVWEIFLPGVGVGTRYGFRILTADGHWLDKADPMAFAADLPPTPASVVTTSTHEWSDAAWLAQRARSTPHAEPMSVYELHVGSWRRRGERSDGGSDVLGYRELADELVEYLTAQGFTHVELLPVAEHPFGGSWGYQVSSYYAPSSRFGTPDDFRYFVDTLHGAGIGVIVDWVPAHFPRDDWALARFDGTALYEHADPRRGEHPDWGTFIFDYGRPEVRNFLVASALCWLEDFHVDGLRVDAVASMLYLDYSRAPGEWVPNAHGGRENTDAVAFLREVNATCYRRVPGIMMTAEESTAWPGVTRPVHLGGLGFGFKWNLGWMHDTLTYLSHDPVFRQYHHNEITFSLMYAFAENFVLPLSHDEVVHGKRSLLGKMPGDEWNRFAGLRALFGYMWAHPGKQLLFMGSEFGQGAEWSAERGLDWWVLGDEHHVGLQQLVKDLNRVYRATPALWALDYSPEGFSWIDANDASGNVLSFLRYAASGDPASPGGPGGAAGPGVLACIVNFSGRLHHSYRVGLPVPGRWREVINSDAWFYGGTGAGNQGMIEAVPEPWHSQPASAVLTLPPLGVLWLAPEG